MNPRPPKTRRLVLVIAVGFMLVIAACGRVVTPEPTRPSSLKETPNATLVTPTILPTGRAEADALPDTVTPTVTPTPLVHVVQQGDTLQAIAFDFGVSVEALQNANGIENPQFLQVGQHLIIPIDEDSDETEPALLLPTPTPQPVPVQGMAVYDTPMDSLLGLGEVANTTAITLTNVQVQVTLLSADKQPLMETDTFVSIDILPPGTCSPFSTLFLTPPPEWKTYQVRVIRAQDAGALAAAYVPVSVVESQGAQEGPQFHVTGAVRNASSERIAESVDVIVTAYDATGTVTGFREYRLPSDTLGEGLAPGAEASFGVTLATHGGVPDDFVVAAAGHTVRGTGTGG